MGDDDHDESCCIPAADSRWASGEMGGSFRRNSDGRAFVLVPNKDCILSLCITR